MVFEERLIYLKQLIKEKEKFNKSYNENQMGEFKLFEDQSQIQKPIIDQLLAIENTTSMNQKQLAITTCWKIKLMIKIMVMKL